MIESMVLSQVFKISALLTFGLDHSLLWGQGEGICTLGMFGSIPPLYSLDASPNHSYHTPVVVIKNVSVQFSRSVVSDSLRPHESQPPDLSITNSRSLLKLMSIELVMPSNHLILCHPRLLLPPIPTSIRVFSNESTLRMRWP